MEIEKKLDNLLRFLLRENISHAERNRKPIESIITELGFIDKDELNELLTILFDDQYIWLESRKIAIHPIGSEPQIIMAKIKTKGKLFISQGGYTGQFYRMACDADRIRNLEERAEKTSNVIRNATVWMAVATVVAGVFALLEVIKFLYSLCHQN